MPIKSNICLHLHRTPLCVLKVKLKEGNVVKLTVVTCYLQSLRPCSEEEVELYVACRSRFAIYQQITYRDGHQVVAWL